MRICNKILWFGASEIAKNKAIIWNAGIEDAGN